MITPNSPYHRLKALRVGAGYRLDGVRAKVCPIAVAALARSVFAPPSHASIFSSKDEPEPKAGGRQREAPFGFGFWFWILRGRTSCRRGGNVGIATAISKGGGKGGKPAFRFSSLSTARHFHRAAWLYVGPLSSGAVFHARQEFLFGLLHRDGRLGIGLFPCQLLQRGKTDAGLQILFAFRHLVEDLEGSGPARVGAAPFAVRFFDDLGYGARPVEVEVGIQIPPMKLIGLLGVLRTDVAEAQMFANHRSILRLHQSVVAAAMRPRFGLLDEQFLQ